MKTFRNLGRVMLTLYLSYIPNTYLLFIWKKIFLYNIMLYSIIINIININEIDLTID